MVYYMGKGSFSFAFDQMKKVLKNFCMKMGYILYYYMGKETFLFSFDEMKKVYFRMKI